MIAACPECGARYRIDPAKLPARGARLRCSRCEGVFRVQADPSATRAPRPAPQAAPAPSPSRAAASTASRPSPPPAQAAATTAAEAAAPRAQGEAPDVQVDVLIAHPESSIGQGVCDALSSWGLRARTLQDGVEAVLEVQRLLPRAVVMGAALPRMLGFQICELMKRNEQLRSIPVVLVGAIRDRERFRRAPQELYGADAYLEDHELPDALAPLFERFGLREQEPPEPALAPPTAPPAAQAPPPSAPPVAQAPAPTAPPAAPTAAPAAQAPLSAVAPSAPSADAGDPEVEKAERFARIIVSDVILYNPERFEAGLQAGDPIEALSAELDEGVALFEQRIGSGRFDARQMLNDELSRQAEARSGR